VDLGTGALLTTETSGPGGGESVAPSEEAAGATVGAANDVAAKEVVVMKRVSEVVTVEKAATVKATAEKEATNTATVEKTTAYKAATDKATVEKATVDRATKHKAVADEGATEEVDAKKIIAAGATEKPTTESVVPDPTIASVAGSKRAATQSNSTPFEKQFCSAWKQQYVVLF
jgi:hypothetical protein